MLGPADGIVGAHEPVLGLSKGLGPLRENVQALASRPLAPTVAAIWRRLKTGSESSPAPISHFVSDVAWLLWQKSLALLPRPQLDIEEREVPALDFAALREQMAALRQAAVWLGRREQANLRSYVRQAAVTPQPPTTEASLEGVSLDALAQVYRRAQSRQDPQPMPVAREAFPLKRMLDQLRGILTSQRLLSFRALLARYRHRREQVAAFLALLELAKQGEISAKQDELWGDIEVRRR